MLPIAEYAESFPIVVPNECCSVVASFEAYGKTRPKQKAGIENMTLQTMIEDNLKSSILELMNSRTIVETPINAQIDNAQLKRISENRVIEQFLSANRPPYHAPKA